MELRYPESVRASLVNYVFTRDVWLNALLHKPIDASRISRRLGVITLHGSEGTAMSGINAWLAPYLASKGYAVLSPNKRDSGKAYYRSSFDWCKDDIASAIRFMKSAEGLEGVALVGHSLGATEATYYAGKTKDRSVRTLVLLGAPLWPKNVLSRDKLSLAERHQGDKKFLIDDGDGMPVSADHYLSYWAPGSNNDIRKWIGKVNVPILNVGHAIRLNSLCNAQASRRIEKLAIHSAGTKTVIIKGAPHSFAGHLRETGSLVSAWLDSVSQGAV